METTLKDEWRVLKMHVELEIKGDGSAIRSRKTPTNRNHSITYYNYKIKNDIFGRRYIKVCPNGKNTTLFVDELVATCFCNPNPKLEYIAHKDGDIANDCFDNLEWVDWDTYLYKYHRNKTRQQNGEIFAWWMKDFYISEKGHLLVDDWVYDSDYYLTGIYDSDLDLRRAVRAYIAWNDDERIFIEDGVKGVWNKVILHIDGDYGNWQESNLKPVDVDSPEACQIDESWKKWRLKENRRFYEARYNEPMPQFLE